MSEQDSRLAVAEMKIEQHERMHQDLQSSIRRLTDGLSELVQAEIRRELDRETFSRISGEIAATRNDLRELRIDFEEHKDAQMEKELAAYKGIVLKLLGLAALIVASVLAGHFGAHLLG